MNTPDNTFLHKNRERWFAQPYADRIIQCLFEDAARVPQLQEMIPWLGTYSYEMVMAESIPNFFRTRSSKRAKPIRNTIRQWFSSITLPIANAIETMMWDEIPLSAWIVYQIMHRLAHEAGKPPLPLNRIVAIVLYYRYRRDHRKRKKDFWQMKGFLCPCALRGWPTPIWGLRVCHGRQTVFFRLYPHTPTNDDIQIVWYEVFTETAYFPKKIVVWGDISPVFKQIAKRLDLHMQTEEKRYTSIPLRRHFYETIMHLGYALDAVFLEEGGVAPFALAVQKRREQGHEAYFEHQLQALENEFHHLLSQHSVRIEMNGSILWQKKRYHAWQHDVLRLFAGEPVTIRQVLGVEGLIIVEYYEHLLTLGSLKEFMLHQNALALPVLFDKLGYHIHVWEKLSGNDKGHSARVRSNYRYFSAK